MWEGALPPQEHNSSTAMTWVTSEPQMSSMSWHTISHALLKLSLKVNINYDGARKEDVSVLGSGFLGLRSLIYADMGTQSVIEVAAVDARGKAVGKVKVVIKKDTKSMQERCDIPICMHVLYGSVS